MAQASLCNVQKSICHRYQECENQIRRSPATSVLGAVAVGYLLHRLPVRAILVTQVRVLAALAPPALILFGAAKLYEFLQRRESDRYPESRHHPAPKIPGHS
jgi:hypothetical protein